MKNHGKMLVFVSMALAFALMSASDVAYAVTYNVYPQSSRLVVTPGSGTQNDYLDVAFGVSSDSPLPLDIDSILDAQPEFSLSYFDVGRGAFQEFYAKVIPRGSLSTNDGIKWSLTDAGRSQTGLERLDILQEVVNVHIDFLDVRTSLPSADYSIVQICITIGPDSGCGQTTLAPAGNVWTVNS